MGKGPNKETPMKLFKDQGNFKFYDRNLILSSIRADKSVA